MGPSLAPGKLSTCEWNEWKRERINDKASEGNVQGVCQQKGLSKILQEEFSKMVLQGDHELASNTAKCWEEKSADRAPISHL